MAANEVIHKTNPLNNLFHFASDEVILPEAFDNNANNPNSPEEITDEASTTEEKFTQHKCEHRRFSSCSIRSNNHQYEYVSSVVFNNCTV